MLKPKIKNILIGLCLLLLMGLFYNLLSAKSEIVSDDSLRVEEALIPEIEAQVERAISTRKVLPVHSVDSNQERESLSKPLESSPLEQRVKPAVVSTIASVKMTNNTADVADVIFPEKMQVATSDGDQKGGGREDDAVSVDGFLTFERVEDLAEASKPAEDHQIGSLNEVSIISDSSEFLDLNLPGAESKQKMVLLGDDQLVFDNINQDLAKYKPMVDTDEVLMPTDSEISEQYHQVMSKLISIKTELDAVDKENAELQAQFNMANNQNQTLTQIIQDIDLQVKRFTPAN